MQASWQRGSEAPMCESSLARNRADLASVTAALTQICIDLAAPWPPCTASCPTRNTSRIPPRVIVRLCFEARVGHHLWGFGSSLTRTLWRGAHLQSALFAAFTASAAVNGRQVCWPVVVEQHAMLNAVQETVTGTHACGPSSARPVDAGAKRRTWALPQCEAFVREHQAIGTIPFTNSEASSQMEVAFVGHMSELAETRACRDAAPAGGWRLKKSQRLVSQAGSMQTGQPNNVLPFWTETTQVLSNMSVANGGGRGHKILRRCGSRAGQIDRTNFSLVKVARCGPTHRLAAQGHGSVMSATPCNFVSSLGRSPASALRLPGIPCANSM